MGDIRFKHEQYFHCYLDEELRYYACQAEKNRIPKSDDSTVRSLPDTCARVVFHSAILWDYLAVGADVIRNRVISRGHCSHSLGKSSSSNLGEHAAEKQISRFRDLDSMLGRIVAASTDRILVDFGNPPPWALGTCASADRRRPQRAGTLLSSVGHLCGYDWGLTALHRTSAKPADSVNELRACQITDHAS